jgi:thioredoxin 1
VNLPVIQFWALRDVSARFCAAAPSPLISGDSQEVPIKGMVTMVDIGAKACIPCKMMIPVIESLSAEYEGRAGIVFIDVWKNPDEKEKFDIRAIPTQIFYDKDGKEVMRHQGYFVLFGLGHCIPIVIAGSSTALARRLMANASWQRGGTAFRRLAGIMIGLMGLYFVARPFLSA